MTRALPLLLAGLALTACADNRSYVAPGQGPADARALANGVADFVSQRLRTPHATVMLAPAQTDNDVTEEIIAALKRRGFGVTTAGTDAAAGQPLRYLVTPLDDGDLLRMRLEGVASGARFFARGPGGLQPSGPFTVTAEAAR